jgi:hypothetical protein
VKNSIFHRALAAALISAAVGTFLSGCRANPVGSGADSAADATVVLAVAGPWTSGGSRLLLGNATWIRVALSADGATTSYEHDIADASFELSAELGKTYTVEASAGNGVDTALYAASATITVGETQTLDLFLLPVETTAWPVIDSDDYTIAPGALAGQTSVTYRVLLGTAARWYINTATGYGTDLQLYVQNEDGSAVAPSAYAADRLVVEKSALAAGADTFLLTVYNASTTSISADVTVMTSLRDAYVGTLLNSTQVVALGGSNMAAGITYLAGKLYIALNDTYDVYSVNTDGTGGAVAFTGYQVPWGIANDGVDLYVAHQYGGSSDGGAARVETGGTQIWTTSIDRASGIAVLGDNVYATSNTNNTVYALTADDGAEQEIIGSGDAASVDGTGSGASFYNPSGICTDGTNVFVVETGMGACKVRKIDPATSAVTTFAGSGTAAIVDGVGAAASFSSINHIASDGTFLYLPDANTIRRIRIATAEVETMFAFVGGTTLDGLVKVGDVLYVTDSDLDCVYRVY